MHSLSLLTLLLAPLALAKTDLAGCTSTAIGNALSYYVPGTGEVCSILDCGGGRAPPKTTVPGCAAYSGTAAYEPSYIAGWGPNGQSAVAATTTAGASVTGSATHAGGAVTSTAAADSKIVSSTVTGGGASRGVTPSANGTLAGSTATPTAFSGSSGAGAVTRNGGLVVVGGAVAVFAMLM